MFQLSQVLLNRPVMSLRTGAKVAITTTAIFNPNNLKIEGFYCEDSRNKKQPLVLLYQDIRDIVPQGIVINDHDVLAEPEDLVRLKKIMELQFELVGKPVISVSKQKLGKVSDYAVETATMLVQKIYVSQSLVKNFSGGGLSVDRSEITEITDKKIVVKDPLKPIKASEAQPAVAPAAPAT